MFHTRVCDIFGIKYPILQSPMNYPVTPALVAGVSNAGGLGICALNMQSDLPTEKHPEMQEEHMRTQVREVRGLTDKPIGINLHPDSPHRRPGGRRAGRRHRRAARRRLGATRKGPRLPARLAARGRGVKLHVDFIELIYRTIYDLSEAPKTSFGDNPRALSGIALEMEMHPLLQRIRRKRLTRTAAYRRRNDMVLRVLEQRTGERYLPVRQRIVWGPVLPQDRGRLAREEQLLVEAGLHSRRRAMETLGIDNPDAELTRVKEEGDVSPQTG